MSPDGPPSGLPTAGLRWSGRTDRGRVRPNNEDAFLGLRFDAREVDYLGAVGEAGTERHDFVFAVSDGMGGARAGEFASRIAVEKITRLLPRSYHQAAQGLDGGCVDVLEELYAQVHRALVHLGNSYDECRGMEATLSLCWFMPGKACFAHVGDSRVYHLPAGTGAIRQLTHDDTYVGWLFRNGKINEREARQHPRRHLLQKALGGGNQFVDPQVGIVPCHPGDLFLLCTDGLFDGLFDAQIEELLRSEPYQRPNAQPALQLVDEAVARHGRDNTTAVVVQVT